MFEGLNTDRVTFRGNSHSAKRSYLLYDRDNKHYYVNPKLKAAMAKKYMCNGCETVYDKTHKCDNVCTTTTPCTKDQNKY